MRRFTDLKYLTLLLTVLLLVLVGCGKQATDTATTDCEKKEDTVNETADDNTTTEDENKTNTKTENKNAGRNDGTVNSTSSGTAVSTTDLDPDTIFSDRDMEQTPDLTDAAAISVQSGQVIDITEKGVYVISGTATDCTIRVEVNEKDKVQLVLDGVSITNKDFPAIYIVAADKCFITTTNSINTLSVTGEFRADGDTNTDAVIFSRDDIVLNGTGTLTVTSAKGNGISCKDDLKVTGGTYIIESKLDGLEANDSLLIADGNLTITSQKDGLHSEDNEDNTTGFIYIKGGSLTIQAKSDGIQGTTFVRIDGGTLKITGSTEGIEATYVEINDGTLDIYASDDGINASRKSTAFGTPTVVFNGGSTKIEVGRGDTDAVDANGSIYVNGGTVDVTAPGMSSFDYDNEGQLNGGTVIINGEQVTSLPASMFGGQGGHDGFGGQGGFGSQGGFGGKGGKGHKGGNNGSSDNNDNNSGFPNFPNGTMPQMPDGSDFPEMPDGTEFPEKPSSDGTDDRFPL